MTALPPVKGISSGAVTSIPTTWNAQWFRRFITTYLQGGDIRNTISGVGIDISGTIAQTAQISVSSSVQQLFNEPYALAVAPSDSALTAYRILTPESGVLTVTDSGAKEPVTIGVATNGIGNAQLRQSVALSVIGNSAATGVANVADIVSSDAHDVLQNTGTGIAFGPLTLAAFPQIANNTVLGNVAGISAVPAALSQTQITALVNSFTATLSGAVPASGGGTTEFLRADGGFAIPSYPSVPSSANPSAQIGLAVVNGVAATWMRSDAAPALFQGVSPTWTALHTFAPTSGVAIQVTAPPGGGIMSWLTGALTGTQSYSHWIGPTLGSGLSGGMIWENNAGSPYLHFDTYASGAPIKLGGLNVTVVTALGVNNNSPPAQSTGWGTPTGGSVQNNFSGAGASLAATSAAVAQLLSIFKAVGFLGA